MPEQRIIEVKPHQLAKGDIVTVASGDYTVTGRPDVKQKYAYVPVAEDSQLRLPLNVEVPVSREFPTEEERAEQNQRRNEEYCYASHGELIERLANYKADLVDNLEIKDPSWHGRYWENIARTQFELELWDSVMTVAENREINVVEALRIVRDQVSEDFIRRFNFLPRSTSPISNYCEQLKNDVTASWLRELEWRIY